MAAKYKIEEVTGNSWLRTKRIVFENPQQHLGPPKVKFVEERVYEVNAENVHDRVARDVGSIEETFTDPTKTFPVINPATGELTPNELSYGELYAMIYSAYIHLAMKRDNPHRFVEDDASEDNNELPPPENTDESEEASEEEEIE